MTFSATTSRRLVRLGLGTAMGALLAGCAATGPAQMRTAAPVLDQGGGDRRVASAEQAVLASPADAAARVALGRAYLQAGRFASAAQAFDDALELGDDSPASALSIALAEAAQGHQADAFRILDEWRDTIPGADLGLAYALAGDPARGVAILSDVMRAGTNTAKVRQNLAYAYALDGRWREAQVMIAQDVPANQVNDRLMQWAQMTRPGASHQRVAQMLGVPVRSDSGLPQALALNAGDAAVLAATTPALMAAPVGEELPAVAPVALAPIPAPAPEPVAVVAERPVAYAALNVPAVVLRATARSVVRQAQPAVSAQPKARLAAVKPAPSVGKRAPMASATPAKGGAYLVQLGSFTELAQAQQAWSKITARNPGLRAYRPITTSAEVNGQTYYRVSAVGFGSRDAAGGVCRQVKARGGPCLVVSGSSDVARARIVGGNKVALARR